jgi:ABC-type antimicrobial peptide transport system permease subunit
MMSSWNSPALRIAAAIVHDAFQFAKYIDPAAGGAMRNQAPERRQGMPIVDGLDRNIVFRNGAIFPGLAIAITVLGFNLLGDGLRDLFDPRRRNA